MVRKKVNSSWRLGGADEVPRPTRDGLRANYFDRAQAGAAEPFALMHHVHG